MGDKRDLIKTEYIIDGRHAGIERMLLVKMHEADERMLWLGQAKSGMALRDGDKPDQWIVATFHWININETGDSNLSPAIEDIKLTRAQDCLRQHSEQVP